MTRHPLRYEPAPTEDFHQMNAYPLLTESTENPIELILGRPSARILSTVWEHPSDEFSVRDIFNTMVSNGYNGKYTTVMTTMGCMVQAGILDRVKDGKAATFSVNYTKQDLVAEVVRRLTR